MVIVNNAVYCAGGEKQQPESLEVTFELLRDRGGLAWIGLLRPTPEEIRAVADEFGLHPLAVEDTVSAHQRPKVERYGDVLFTVLRPATYDGQEIDLGELHVFTGPDFVVTVRHADLPDLSSIRTRMESDPELLAQGPEAVLYAILDKVVDDYAPVADELEGAIDNIETEVFKEAPGVSQRLYALSREVSRFHRSTSPLISIMEFLTGGFESHSIEEELQRLLRDVQDHVLRLVDRVEGARHLLQELITINSTLVAQRQNDRIQQLTESQFAQGEQVKKISSWAAILFAPTLIASIYGMNFVHMPELKWHLGYPYAIALMLAMGVGLYVAFRRRSWI
jgi:magnesium transporter